MGESKGRQHNYEGMFLVSQATASDLQGSIDHIREILARGDVEMIAMQKWDERRLAYEIRKHKRGVYFLTYFSADPTKIELIERAANLSEQLLRFMVLRADHLTLEEMQAADEMSQLADEARLRAERREAEEAEASARETATSASE